MVIRLSSLPKLSLSISGLPQILIFISSIIVASMLLNHFNLEKAHAYFGNYSPNCPVYSGSFKNVIPVAGSNVPQNVYDSLNCADQNAVDFKRSPTVATFGVVTNTGMSDSASIPSTTKNLTLTFGAAATVGATNSAVTNVYYNVVDTSPRNVTSGIIGTQTQADLSGGYTTKGWTGISLRNFTYSGYGEGWNGLQLNVQVVNRFRRASDGAISFRCVAPPGSSTSSSIGSNCPVTAVYIRVYVYIIPPPPVAGSCYLVASTTSPLPGSNVEINAYVTNFSGRNWNYSSSRSFTSSNYTLGVVNASRPYYNVQQPYADVNNIPPTSTYPYSGAVDYDNGTVGALPTSTLAGYQTQSYFISGYGPTGITRYGMKQTVPNGGTVRFSFFVRAPSTVGQSYNIGARVMDRGQQVFFPWYWFNMDTCTVRITAANPVATAICTFTSPTVEQGSYAPSATVTNTSPSATTFRLRFSITGKIGTYESSPGGVSIPGNNGTATISSTTPVTFNYGEEKNWDVTVTVINVADGAIVGSGCNGNYIVVRKPFFRVNNGDLMMGGKYPSSISPGLPSLCSNTSNPANTSLVSWTDRALNRGAYAEHVIKLLGGVHEVYSAQSITSPPSGLANKWLTIANNADTWGASSGSSSCMNDLYTDAYLKSSRLQFNSLSNYTIPSTWNDPANPDQIEITTSTPLPINPAGPVNFTAGKLALYVNGDVYIANNITMNTIYTSNNLATGSSDVSKIPFFALIVSGNIYIAPGVTQLDGVYISQPKTDGSKGVLYTCANSSGSAVAQGSVYGSCGSPLVFNGIVQAKSIRLLRTNGTLATNTPAETFNGRPELYIAPKPFGSGASSGSRYDNAATLPPAL